MQLVRAFSGYQYQPGMKNGVLQPLRLVPCRMANTNRMVGHIMRNLSENSMLAVPLITIFQNGFTGRREHVQYPGFTDNVQVNERAVLDGKYTTTKGNAYTVERTMPRPFEMTIAVDVWTSNLDQKYQLMEQILTVIYPSFDIQSSTNALDWTALTTVYCEDITLSSRNVPIGTDSEIDILSINLRVPMWLSPPVKVTQQTIIQTIISNVFEGTLSPDGDLPANETLMCEVLVTPGDRNIYVEGEVITLLNKDARSPTIPPPTGVYEPLPLPSWADTLIIYGTFRPAQSKVRLYTTSDIEGPYVVGTLQADPNNVNQLIWQVDPTSLPKNTLAAVNAIIDPMRTYPDGVLLPAPVEGVRYLIINDIGPSVIWPNLTAYANDIIQYANGAWTVSFNSKTAKGTQYVLNLHTSAQLRWMNQEWVMSIDGHYGPGFWRLEL